MNPDTAITVIIIAPWVLAISTAVAAIGTTRIATQRKD